MVCLKRARKRLNSYIKEKVIADRQTIEKSFAEFEANRTISEEEMKKEFGKYG